MSHGVLPSGLLVFTDQQLGLRQIHVGGTSRLSGAGFLNTRPASQTSNRGKHRKPPFQSSGSEGCGPGNFSGGRAAQVGANAHGHEDFGLDRAVLVFCVLGVVLSRALTWVGQLAILAGRASSCALVRLRIHTGLPRHSTVIFSPGCSAEEYPPLPLHLLPWPSLKAERC